MLGAQRKCQDAALEREPLAPELGLLVRDDEERALRCQALADAGDLEGALKERGIESDIFIMQSNAGLVPPELAREMPIRIVESGPAAGVMMAQCPSTRGRSRPIRGIRPLQRRRAPR